MKSVQGCYIGTSFIISLTRVILFGIAWHSVTYPALAQSITPTADGTGTLVTPDGNRIDIHGGTLSENGANLFHSFQKFGLDAGQIANFVSNLTIRNILGRVQGGEPSLINGLIQVSRGNSNLFLMNPAGIIFGSGASLNVPASFTATTATGIGFEGGWFQAFGTNDYRSLVGSPNAFRFGAISVGAIINAGNLAVGQGQSVSLIGGTVINTGTLQAPGGNITVMAVPGTSLVRVKDTGQLLSLEIAPPTDEQGKLLPIAPSMLPELLTGSHVETGLRVNPDRTVQSISGTLIPTQTGTAIVLGAGFSNASGTLKSANGEVNIFGDRIGLFGASINVAGANGGTVRLGGDYQGKGTLPTASRTFVSSDSIINASALHHGNGGRVIVWSNELTQFNGQIDAQGGIYSGSGGFVEVSGKKSLIFDGTVNLSAVNGNWGTLLLDPENITIVNGNRASDDRQLLDGAIFASDPGGTLFISERQLELQLLRGNVVLQATNNITINKLTNGILGNPFNPTPGSIAFIADADNNGIGSFLMDSRDTIVTSRNGGAITISGANIATGRLISRDGIALTASGNITTSDLASFQNINLIAGGSISTNRILTGGEIAIRNTTVSLGNGNAADISLLSNGNITTGGINASSADGNGGNVTLFSRDGSIRIDPTRGDLLLRIDNEPLTADGAVFAYSGNSGRGGTITLSARGNITTGPLVSGSLLGDGGNINLTSTAGAIDTSEGAIRFRGQTIPDTGILLSASGDLGTGGDITVTASGNIITGSIVSGSLKGDGGDINLTSTTGAINTLQAVTSVQALEAILAIADVSLNSLLPQTPTTLFPLGRNIAGSLVSSSGEGGTGGTITVSAKNGLFLGGVVSGSMEGDGGNIRLTSLDRDIEAFLINTQSLGAGRGGNVDVNANGLFRVSGSVATALQQLPGDTINPSDIPPKLDRQASISTSGSAGGGSIVIRHGGGLRGIPFTVGNATINGTVGRITSGNFTLPTRAYEGNYTLGNIRIITPTRTQCPPNCSTPSRVGNQNPTNVVAIDNSPVINPVRDLEGALSDQYTQYLGLENTRSVSLAETQSILRRIEQKTGVKPALIYAMFVPSIVGGETTINENQFQFKQTSKEPLNLWQFNGDELRSSQETGLSRRQKPQANDELELVLVTSKGEVIRRRVAGTKRQQVLNVVEALRTTATNIRNSRGYLAPAQRLYQWLVAPIEKDLQAEQIDNLSFIMDSGLRSIPLAALHNGKNFIVENYSVGLMPSFSLTDTRYVDVRNMQVLAMGADQFSDLRPLPSVPVELSLIADQLWSGESFLNQAFTLTNLQSARSSQSYGIIHLATHAEFQPGSPSNSYIQLWDTKLRLDQWRGLGLNQPSLELLVLSACRTALGDEQAELGFTGLAVQAGVKSALGSLWYVSDEATMAFMTEFYKQLKQASTKAEALRQAQLAMLRGEVRLQGGQLVTSFGSFPLPPNLAELGDRDLSHPYYWSAFMMIGNPW
jgi:filamentous hemagglutinin family protein